MSTLHSLKYPIAAAALLLVPMMSFAEGERDRDRDATFVRFCHFDAPDQAEDCSAEIIQCDLRERDRQNDDLNPMTASFDDQQDDRGDRDRGDRDQFKCRDELKITCGGERIFKGPYSQDFERGRVRVTAGKHPRPGAPEIIHDAFKYLPSRVDAKLILGDSFLRGSCRGKIIR